MSAKHPTPWTVINCNNGARGKRYCEWGIIADDNGFIVVDGLDSATAREIAEAVTERAALRDMVRRLANMAETTIPDAMENWDGFTSGRVEFEREAYALIREARALSGGAQP